MVVALISLFVALGSSAVAAAVVPPAKRALVAAAAADAVPTSNGAGWQTYLINTSSTDSASGTVVAVC